MDAIARRTLAASALAVGLFTVNASAQVDKGGPPEIVPHHINPHTMGDAVTAGSTSQIKPTISYHGGPVMGAVTPYLIWYGNWNQNNGSDTPSGQQLVRDFLHGLSGSNYYKTNASYSGVAPNGLINPVAQEASVTSASGARWHGTTLTDANIQTIVSEAIANGMAKDYSGVYFVITSSEVNESSGFCTQYCGWHTHGTIGGLSIKYSFVGNANRCLSSCAMQSTGPNGNAGVDGMLSVLAHELEEANTDPELNAWYNNRGYENADMCAWTFGTRQFQAANGAWANLQLPSTTNAMKSYLIQRQLASDSKCYIDYPNRVQ